jgi:hypothetical protein
MAGTVSITRVPLRAPNGGKVIEKVKIDWVADGTDATVPNTSIPGLYGFLVKVITNPGSTAPTANYDIALLDPDDSGIDATATLLNNRHTTSSEQVYPLISGAATPIFLAGDYTFNLTNNAVNSANGQVILYLVESL